MYLCFLWHGHHVSPPPPLGLGWEAEHALAPRKQGAAPMCLLGRGVVSWAAAHYSSEEKLKTKSNRVEHFVRL